MGFLKNEQLKLPLYFLVIMLCSCTDGRIMLEEQLYQGFACYGDHEEYGFINASCPSGSVIAPGDVTYGVKLRNLTKCTGYILRNNTLDYYQLCCKPDAANENTDCFLVEETNSPYLSCTGRAVCSIRADWLSLTNTMCGTIQYGSVYETSVTSYMIFNYFCVEETRVYTVNSVDETVRASIIYLWNSGYPNGYIPANTKKTCSVEMENCSATISVITVHINLPTVSNGTCNHTIKILTSNGKVVQTLPCAVYKYINSIYTSSDNYLYIETENLSLNQSGQYWLGFQATTTTTFHVSCPGKNRTYCIPTTTTPATTSTTTTITTSTTTSIPTPRTTRNETQTPSTSTTTQTTTSNKPSSIPTTSPTATPFSATTTNSTNQYPTPVNKSENDSNIGLILGVVLGSVAVIAVIIVLCILWRKSKKRTDIPTEETMIESTSSHLQLRNGVAPTDHFVVTSKPRGRKHKKLKANSLDQEDYEISKRKIERKKERRERKKEKIRRKRKDTIQAAKNLHVEGGETNEDQTSFPSDHPNSDAPIRGIYGTETAEMGQTDRGNGENGKTKNEKRRKKTKKKHKHKEHHVYNTIVQTADKDQSDLQIGHTEGVNVGESQSRAHSDIVDETKTMLKGDAVPDDTKKHRRKRKKLRSEPVRVMEDTEQEGNEENGKSHGKKRKKRKKHAQKEDKRHSYDVDERLPPFEEPVHRFENEVYPSSDSN